MSGLGGLIGTPEVFIGFKSAAATSTTTLAIDKPAGTASGDVLLAVLCSSTDSVTFTGASGWTEIYDSGGAPSLRLARLTAGGSEPSSYTFTASSSVALVGQIICLRGLQFDTAGAAMSTLTGDGNLVIGGITAAGGLLIAAAVSNQTATNIAHSTPSGMVRIATTTIPFVEQPGLSTFFQNIAAGATGTRTTAVTGGTVESGGILVGFKP
jgi:hypothetical protein